MIANVVVAISKLAVERDVYVSVAYSPSRFTGASKAAPIRLARPIRASLAGWSSRPELPLAVIAGLGCEPGLALGALQLLEPDKAWLFSPRGVDPNYDLDMKSANEHIADIFDVTNSEYEITKPSILRGRYEALLNAVEYDFRIITLPFGPKIFAWSVISTVVFMARYNVGVWTFSSRERGALVNRSAEGPVLWHRLAVTMPKSEDLVLRYPSNESMA